MTTWTNGDISGSQTLTALDHLYESHINELRVATNLRALDNLAAHLAGAETFTSAKTWNAGTFLDKGNLVYDVKAYGALDDARKVTDASISSASSTLTSATAAFVTGDTGKIFVLPGAGVAGAVLSGTITYVSATQVTLSVAAGTTVSGAAFAFGTNDLTAIQAAVTAAKAAGGGKIRLGLHHITNDRVYYDRKNLSIEGWPYVGTTMYSGFDVTSGIKAMFTFYSDDTTTIGNLGVKDVKFDHMGCRTPGVYIAGNTSSAGVSRGFFLERLEAANRAGSSDGTWASVVVRGKYTGVAGSLADVHIDLYSHDNTAANGTKPYSINILSDDLDGLWVKGRFEELYGTTISMGAGTTRTRKNFNFDITCFRTKKRIDTPTGTFADIFDASRQGFMGIDVTGHFDDDDLFDADDDNFHLAFYETRNSHVHDAKFFNSRAVIAPGQSTPNGHENIGALFNDNIIYNAISFSDSDGQIGYICNDNVFIGVEQGPILFGYGVQQGNKHHGNVLYNCLTDPNTSTEYSQSLFLSEMGGQDYDGNIIYDDLGAASKMKHVFAELYTTGDITFPNSYRNNKIMVTSDAAEYVDTFYLDSYIDHEFMNNTGVKEARIQNSLRANDPQISALKRTDVVSNNWRADGIRVLENENGSTAMKRTGDYMTSPLILGQGYAVQTTGVIGSYVNAGNNAAILRGAVGEPFTLSCRLKLDATYSFATQTDPINLVGRYYLAVKTNGKITGQIWGGGGPQSSTVLAVDTPYDVLFTWDGVDEATISIDGVVEETVTTSSTASASNSLYIGKQNGTAGTEFKGIIDKVEMWNRVLTAEEQYTVGNGGIAPTSGLVLQLGFDEQSTLDTSVTGNTVSATGTSYVTGIAPPVSRDTTNMYSLGSARIVGTGTMTKLNTATATPASAAASGTAGDFAWDGSFLYMCTATNTWKRVAIATW